MNEFDHTGIYGRSGDLGQTPGRPEPESAQPAPGAGNPWAGHGEPGLGQPGAGQYPAGQPTGGHPFPGHPGGGEPGGNPYATGQFGPGHYGANPYGTNQYGANQYGANQYGANQYGAAEPGQHGYPYDPYRAWGTQQPPTGQWDTRQLGYPAGYPRQPARHHPIRSIGITLGAIGLSVLIGLGIGRLAWHPDNASASPGADQNFGNSAPPAAGGNSGGGSSNGGGSGNGSGNGGGPSNGGGSSNGGGTTSIDPTAIAGKVDPGLVDINTVLGYQQAQAAGTGIVLTGNGEILTNNHVVEGATSIKVTDIGNGQTYTASVIGYDRSHDVAVLSLTGASGLTTASLGDSGKVSVGDAVVGIGNAGGAGGTPSVAAGRVTDLNQSITASDDSSGASERLTGLIQVDANIQAGDSGGALADSSGQVVGMDTAASVGTQFQGGGSGDPNDPTDPTASGHEGFAIPINQAVSIAHQIVGRTPSTTVHIGTTAFLGVGLADQRGAATGAAVQNVVSGSAAERAGLVAGDVITALDGQQVDSASTLTNLMDTHHPGDHLKIAFTDQAGARHTVTVVPTTGPVG